MATSKKILSIVVAAYNRGSMIDDCLKTFCDKGFINDIEVIVVNDGSTDDTVKRAEKYCKKYPKSIKIIHQKNSGAGAAVNNGIKHATGKYLRLVDGDDWVDGENLTKLVEILKHTNADIVLTKGSYEYTNTAILEDIIKYDNLIEGQKYNFDDLTYKGYGFERYGPLLTTGNYRTEVLKKAKFKISEKRPYVDMEFNSFSLKYVETIEYYDLDIYRYLNA